MIVSRKDSCILVLFLALFLSTTSVAAECIDLEGDGYGMNGDRPCRTRKVRTRVNQASQALSILSQTVDSSQTSATLRFKFDSAVKATLKFGETSNLNRSGPYRGYLFLETFSQELKGLKPDTKYYFQIKATSRDRRKQMVSEVFEFRTLPDSVDTTDDSSDSKVSPTLKNAQVSEISSNSAKIDLELTGVGRAVVRYGTKNNLSLLKEFSYADLEVAAKHTHNLPGLKANTDYFFVVVSFDAEKKLKRNFSDIATFRTLSNNDTPVSTTTTSTTTTTTVIETPTTIQPTTTTKVLPPGTTDGDCISFGDISKSAPDEYCLSTKDEYLGEYLRQRPNVAWWYIDDAKSCIQDIAEPSCTKTISVSPSGGANDASILKAAMQQAGDGGCVDGGNQTFNLRPIEVKVSGVTFKNMKFVATGNAYVLVDVIATDVSFINTPIDVAGKNVNLVFQIRNNSHRFSMVNGGVSNVRGTVSIDGGASNNYALVKLQAGVNDVYIVNNEFKNIHTIGIGEGRFNGTLRGVHYAGTTGVGRKPSPGIVASNLFEDFQVLGTSGLDADAIVFGGWETRDKSDIEKQIRMTFSKPMKILANIGIDSGKRLVKNQAGSFSAHGNFSHWKTAASSDGPRKVANHFALHTVGNNTITNNHAIADKVTENGWNQFVSEFTHFFYKPFHRSFNNKISCNIYEYNSREKSAGGYFYRVLDYCNDDTPSWPKNSEVTNNHIRGTGAMEAIYWFQGGNDEYGTQFNHSGNTHSVDFLSTRGAGVHLTDYNGDIRKLAHCPKIIGQ